MTQADAAALAGLSNVMTANNRTGVQFKTAVTSDNGSNYQIELWNSYDEYTEKLSTAQAWADFFRTKFALSPIFCFHRSEYRNPKDDASRPFICPHCERLSYEIDVHETLTTKDSVTSAVRKAED